MIKCALQTIKANEKYIYINVIIELNMNISVNDT